MISFNDLGEVSEVPNVTSRQRRRELRPISYESQFVPPIHGFLHYTAMGSTFSAVVVASNKERGEYPAPRFAPQSISSAAVRG
uniref:Uncharacterized protein n=1 Tax=Ixodes ricinus TaxID=34613 RepID=A0A090X9W2_IXORI